MTLFFTTKNGHVLTKIDDSSLKFAASVQITWHIQKNCQNIQKIKLSADTKNPLICPVWGALRMVMRAHHLAQPAVTEPRKPRCYSSPAVGLLHSFARQ
jgi:hypothetical protein